MVELKSFLQSSSINIYKIDKDVEGRLRLYPHLTAKPAELKQKYKELYPDDIKPEQEEASWDAYLEFLMSKIDDKYKTQVDEHINSIANNQSLATQATEFFTKYKNAFNKMIKLFEKAEWAAGYKVWDEEIGTLQRKLPRWCLYKSFLPDKPFFEFDDPEKPIRTGFEAEPDTLHFTLEGDRNLFSPEVYKRLGKSFGVFRGRFKVAGRQEVAAAGDGGAELNAVSREIEVNHQKSIKESRALQPPAPAPKMKQ